MHRPVPGNPVIVPPGRNHGRWGFTVPLPPRPVGAPPGRYKILTWTSPDGLPHLVNLQMFMNNAMAQVGFIPTAVIAVFAAIEWQNDAGEFNAEVDLHFGQSFNLTATGLTVTVVTESMTSASVPELTGTVALAIDAAPVSGAIQPQRTFSFFDLAGLGATLPISVFVPNFAREFTIVRTNDPPAGVPAVGSGALNDIQIRVDSIPFGRRSQHLIGAGADPGKIALFNSATQVTVDSTGNPVGLNIIFFLDL